MDALEKRIFLIGLRIDLATSELAAKFGTEDPFTIGHCLLPLYHSGELDRAIMENRLG